VEFRSGRLVVHPIEIDSGQARTLHEKVEGAVYESLKRTLRVRLSDEPQERFAAVVQIADALLRVKQAEVPAAA
jgi:transcription-repair coupling factor (superfamily II helicase)